MTSHKTVRLAISALALSGVIGLTDAHAQASFTIRSPKDGTTLREKRPIEIPRVSIKPGGFVAFYLDDEFLTALAPEQDDSSKKPFTYLWDTKGTKIADGEHTIKAVLYEPTAGSSTATMTEKGVSEVKVIVANKIKGNPGPMLLRYKYMEGQITDYSRDGKTVVVSGVTNTGQSQDTDLASVRSKLMLEIQDSQPVVSLVRNKLTELSILTGGQETTYESSQLSNSMYQELNGMGAVLYETGASSGLAEFAEQGLPVNNTLELPVLPRQAVTIGSTWNTTERLDVPGLPPSLQPKVTLKNKFVGLEWESDYQTAKIEQTYEGTSPTPTLTVAGIEVTSPTVKYQRDIYFAYKAGRLVKTVRTLTISGRTASSLPTGGGSGPIAGTGGGAPGGMMGMAGMMGMGARMAGAGGGGGFGPPSGVNPGSSMSGRMSGFPGGGGFGPPSGVNPGSSMGGRMSGFPGGGIPGAGRMPRGAGGGGGKRGDEGGGASAMAGMMSSMMRGGGAPGFPGGGAGGMRPGAAAARPQETDTAVTLKAISTTQILKVR